MKQLLYQHKFKIFIALILATSLFLRLYQLTAIPSVVSHDEIYYLLESKSIALSGKDPTGQYSPLRLLPANPLYAELPGLVMAPAQVLFPNSPLFAARITHVLLGTLMPFLLAGIVWQLFKRKDFAIATILLTTFNPWFFQISRTSFDAYFSLFFYLLALWLILLNKPRLWILAMTAFVLGFYQYQGLKILLPLIAGSAILYVIIKNENLRAQKLSTLISKSWKSYKWLLIGGALLSLLLVIQVIRLQSTSAGGRVNDLIFFNETELSARVNFERQTSIANPFQKIAINKLTIVKRIFMEKYLAAFNVNELFLNLDTRRNPFAVWSRGIFYPIDFFLIFFGALSLTKVRIFRKQAGLLFFQILIAPLPLAINSKDTWMMFRASFLFPWLIVLASIGVVKIWRLSPPLFKILLVLVYTVFVMDFWYQYFYRFPIYAAQDHAQTENVMANYVRRINNNQQVIVHAQEPYFVFTSLISLGNLVNSQNLDQVQTAYQTEKYQLGNLTVTSGCIDHGQLSIQDVLIADTTTPLCDGASRISATRVLIPSLIDSGGIYEVFQDPLCHSHGLDRFSHINQPVFDLPKLSNEQFCRNFFIREGK